MPMFRVHVSGASVPHVDLDAASANAATASALVFVKSQEPEGTVIGHKKTKLLKERVDG